MDSEPRMLFVGGGSVTNAMNKETLLYIANKALDLTTPTGLLLPLACRLSVAFAMAARERGIARTVVVVVDEPLAYDKQASAAALEELRSATKYVGFTQDAYESLPKVAARAAAWAAKQAQMLALDAKPLWEYETAARIALNKQKDVVWIDGTDKGGIKLQPALSPDNQSTAPKCRPVTSKRRARS